MVPTDTAMALIRALTAARNGAPPQPGLAQAIRAGGKDISLDSLGFDSLALMEFCISVELQTGAELTPDVLYGLATLADVADWIVAWNDR